MNQPVILTGLRANQQLHLGNYLGALLPLVDMAQRRVGEYQINLFVPDLHSFTTPIDHDTLQANLMANLKLFVAAGLPIENESVYLYRQSYIPAHSELTWILDCFTGMGEMNRMTQFKEKAATLSEDRISVGLFNYPVLMAADILLYDAVYIPVGDDQTQHIEYARDIAMRLNKRFGELFSVPKPVAEQHRFFGKDQGLRIRDLVNPTKKMSKSDESGKGVIFLNDSETVAREKILAATTDSLNKVAHVYTNQPGISNLLDILELLGGDTTEFIGQTQYGPLKTAVADAVASFLYSFQSKLAQVDENKLLDKLADGEVKMGKVAANKLTKVQKAIGLRA